MTGSRRTWRALGLAAVVAALVAGCAFGGALDRTSWRLTEWTVSSIDPAQVTITASFADGQLSGNSGVNTYGGPYTAGPGSAFRSGPLAMTEMAGPEFAMRAEGAYHELLAKAASYKVEGTTLTLFDEGGNPSLVFTAVK